MTARYFDRYVIVDWSAAARPVTGKDSIWIADISASGNSTEQPRLYNPPTRLLAHTLLESILTGNEQERILVGFDFPLGFPAGASRSWANAWRELSEAITEGPRNINNRFEVAAGYNRRMGASAGPFWACPPAFQDPRLLPTSPVFPVKCADGRLVHEYRIAEKILRSQKKRPQSVWKLFTQASVGSQTLTGIPILCKLREHPQLLERIRIWPFETHFNLPTIRNAIVFAEVWPTIIPTDPSVHTVKDAAQVITYGTYVKKLDRMGELVRLFGVPKNLTAGEVDTAVREEGWILGVGG